MNRVLLVATVPALDAYSIGVISAAFNCKNMEAYACIFLDGSDRCTNKQQMQRYGLLAKHSSRVQFHQLAENKMIRNLSGRKYLSLVKAFAVQRQISLIHFISQDVMLHGHLSMFIQHTVYYTVHDLVPHPVNLNLLQRIKHYYFRIRKDRMLIDRVNHLVTNSTHQHALLEKLYPNKKIYRHQMPSNVTPAIRHGAKSVPELKNWKDYVLFFGRIEHYKGIEELYQAFISNTMLVGTKLVIAGKGDIYFDRIAKQENNILFINRYISDEEVGDLFTNATLLVLPYHSATQSAVTSIGYYYHIPVVAANVEGLTDTIISGKTGLLYNPAQSDGLVKSIKELMSDSVCREEIRSYLKVNQPFFSEEQLSLEIEKIYFTKNT